MVKHLNSDNSKTAQQLFLILCETIQFNAIYMMEVVTKDGNFLVKTDFEARGASGIESSNFLSSSLPLGEVIDGLVGQS